MSTDTCEDKPPKNGNAFKASIITILATLICTFLIFLIPRTVVWPEKVNFKLAQLEENDKKHTEIEEKLAETDLNLSKALVENNTQLCKDVDNKLKEQRELRDKEINRLYQMIERIDSYIKQQ